MKIQYGQLLLFREHQNNLSNKVVRQVLSLNFGPLSNYLLLKSRLSMSSKAAL